MDVKSLEQYLNYIPHIGNPQYIVDDIIQKAKEYLSENQISEIQRAYEYARQAHGGQLRLSGEEYIVHPLKATEFLMEIKPDIQTIQASILHDVIEDTPITEEDIKKSFGEEVSNLCEGMVKVSKIKYKGEDRHLETIKKTFLAMANDLRVIFIKLCDRIHNIQTLQYHPNPSKIQKIAQETMKIYVPIAKRLGLYYYQLYLENGSFKHLDEPAFNKIFNYLKKYFGTGEKYTYKGIDAINSLLKKEGVEDFELKGRIKSPYRVYEKLEKKYKTDDIGEVMDLLAFRVITKTVADCYMILGVVHKYYTPLIKKIKDYIAVPKSNGYQSIHTTVLGMFSFPIEIQIRTHDMDEVAEYGVAAHFAYSEFNKPTLVAKYQGQWIKKLQEIVQNYRESDDKERFKDELKIEVLDKRIYLYTPKGDVVEIPNGSSVLDFAFLIHSDIGLRFKNAIVNGQIKPISYRPKTGDVISINTFKNKYSANKHWFDFLHTMGAKSNLNKHLKSQQKLELVKKATSELNTHLEKIKLPKLDSGQDKISKMYSKTELEKKFMEILDRKSNYSQLIKSAYPIEREKQNKSTNQNFFQAQLQQIKEDAIGRILIDGDRLSNYSLCKECHPGIHDKIIAKSGRDGVKVHKTNCKSLKTINFDKLLEAHREGQEINNYEVSIELKIFNKYSSLLDVMNIFSDLHIVILQISIKNNGDGTSDIFLDTEFKNPARIAFLLNSLKKYDDSIKVNSKKIS
ncbi:MAG: RelA/SpoT family protein [Candidatus Absconditabacteria bacterium]|nr:RelA/SpoT family protein [Candidatus Absconditabacteria bacterium]